MVQFMMWVNPQKGRQMKHIFLVLVILVGGCLNFDEDEINKAVDDGVERCELVVEEKVDEVWEKCASYYEDEIVPLLQEIITDLQAELDVVKQYLEGFEEYWESMLHDVEVDVMTRLGCVAISVFPDQVQWDCSESEICL
jgi:hypothetical protein